MYGSETPQDNGINDFTKMSSDDLKSILCEDLNSAEPDKLSVDEIKFIVGLLKKREENALCDGLTDSNIRNKITEQKEVKGVKIKASVLRRKSFFRIVAAVTCALLIGIITVSAYNIDIVSIFKSWTEELFQINYSGDVESSINSQDEPTDKMTLESCNSASEVLSALEVTQPLLPSWIPEDYSLSEFQVNVHSDRTTIYEYYQSSDLSGEFSIQINIYSQLPENESSWYQKDSASVETFNLGGIVHYIMSNLGDNTAVWTVKNYECSIGGNISVDTLKKMIDSIYS